MKAIIITATKEEVTDVKNNNVVHITEEHEHHNDFMKVLAIKGLIDYLVDLPKLTVKDSQCVADPETFRKYVNASDIIDHYFANLIEGYFENCECDDAECEGCTCHCCEDDDSDCDDCERECCESDDESIESIMDETMINDAINLAKMFKPVFNLNNIKEDNEVKIVMSGKEYLAIKDILDKYEFDEDEDTESSNT